MTPLQHCLALQEQNISLHLIKSSFMFLSEVMGFFNVGSAQQKLPFYYPIYNHQYFQHHQLYLKYHIAFGKRVVSLCCSEQFKGSSDGLIRRTTKSLVLNIFILTLLPVRQAQEKLLRRCSICFLFYVLVMDYFWNKNTVLTNFSCKDVWRAIKNRSQK